VNGHDYEKSELKMWKIENWKCRMWNVEMWKCGNVKMDRGFADLSGFHGCPL